MTIPADATDRSPGLTALRGFCRTHGVRRLGLFGSVPRGDFRQDSDLDVLIEFTQGCTPGLRFWDIEDEMSRLLGRRAELHTVHDLSPYFRDQVLSEVQWLYVQPPEK